MIASGALARSSVSKEKGAADQLGLQEGLEAHDRKLGLGPSGPAALLQLRQRRRYAACLRAFPVDAPVSG
jgi:hypothetical protein